MNHHRERQAAWGEALLEGDSDVSLRQLELRDIAMESKGSIEASFRRNLFSIPFGRGFYAGLRAERVGLESELVRAPLAAKTREPSPYASWRNASLIGTAASGVAAAATYGLATIAYDDYRAAAAPADARDLRHTVERRLLASRIMLGTAGALAVTTGVLQWLDWRSQSAQSVAVLPANGGAEVSFETTW
jgi:hypothetical protein